MPVRAAVPRSKRAADPQSARAAPPRMRRKSAVRGSTRERILAAAERLFAEQGFSLVSMPSIGAASGVTAGAIYKHFDSKAALFFEVVRRTVETAPLPEAGEAWADGAGLPALVGAYTTRRLKRLRQLAVEMHYASARDPSVRRLLRRSLEGQIGGLADSLAQARRGRAAPRGAGNPELMAPMIFVVIMGLMHMETLLPHLVDDDAWRDFVESRIAAMLSVDSPPP
jgi:AcrR family transcriptional regulator